MNVYPCEWPIIYMYIFELITFETILDFDAIVVVLN